MAITFGAWAGKLLTLRRQVSFEAAPRLCDLNLLEGGRRLGPLEEFSLSKPGFFALAGSERRQGTERSGEEEPTQQSGRGGLISPLGGTRRSRIGSWFGLATAAARHSGRRRARDAERDLGFKKASQEVCPRRPRERAELSPQGFLFLQRGY